MPKFSKPWPACQIVFYHLSATLEESTQIIKVDKFGSFRQEENLETIGEYSDEFFVLAIKRCDLYSLCNN